MKIRWKLLFVLIILFITYSCREVGKEVKNKRVNSSDRVGVAYAEKETLLRKLLMEKGIDWTNFEVFFRVFKQEEVLEVWAKNKTSATFLLIKKYPFCTSSGTLGPKRKEGDRQIPEGFYYINRFNPKSNFYLSLGLNYPNESDLILSDKLQPGSDIFIHGACVSVGCVSITDDKIKEVYVLANEAKQLGQARIEVHFFPFRLKNRSIEKVINGNTTFAKNELFWENLKVGFDKFEVTQRLFDVEVDANGRYIY